MEAPKPPKEDQAPAYMASYAALWCIMLAFFVTVLSMGHQRTEDFKKGLGEIKNAFGRDGGFGLLQYMRGHRMTDPSASQDSRREDTEVPQDERAELIGFFKNMLWREGLSSVAILDVKIDDSGANVILQTPIEFQGQNANLDMPARRFLNKIGTIFYNRSDLTIRVDCLTRPIDGNEEIVLALERAAAVTRYLSGECRIADDRLSSLGYGSTRFMLYLPSTNIEQTVVFSVRKGKNRG